MTFGEALKKYRNKCGYTQKQLSDRLGYASCQFVSNLERSISNPSPKKAMQISKVVGIPMKLLHDIFMKKEISKINKRFEKYL